MLSLTHSVLVIMLLDCCSLWLFVAGIIDWHALHYGHQFRARRPLARRCSGVSAPRGRTFP